MCSLLPKPPPQSSPLAKGEEEKERVTPQVLMNRLEKQILRRPDGLLQNDKRDFVILSASEGSAFGVWLKGQWGKVFKKEILRPSVFGDGA